LFNLKFIYTFILRMKNIRHIQITLFFAIINLVMVSAPPPPPSGGPSCWPPPCIPADNGIIFLIAAGALLGAKKIYDLRKKSSSAY
jgi:hypothetical protein